MITLRRLRYAALVTSAGVGIVLGDPAVAQQRYADVFEPGSTNAVVFDVLSSADKPVTVRASASVQGNGVTIGAVSPSTLTLEPFGEASVRLDFSVAADAAPGQSATIALVFTAEGDVPFENPRYELAVEIGRGAATLPSTQLDRLRALAGESAALASEADSRRAAANAALGEFDRLLGLVAAATNEAEAALARLRQRIDAMQRDAAEAVSLNRDATAQAETTGRQRDIAVRARGEACAIPTRMQRAGAARRDALLEDAEQAAGEARTAQVRAAEAAAEVVRSAGRLARLTNDGAAALRDSGAIDARLGASEDTLDRAQATIDRVEAAVGPLRGAHARLQAIRAEAVGLRDEARAVLAPALEHDDTKKNATTVQAEVERLYGLIVANAVRLEGRAEAIEADAQAAAGRLAGARSAVQALAAELAGITLPEVDPALQNTAPYLVEFATARGADAKTAAIEASACVEEARAQATAPVADSGVQPGNDALRACDYGAMSKARAKLAGEQPAPGPEGRAVLARLDAELAAKAQFDDAQRQYSRGALDAAERGYREITALAPPPSCGKLPARAQARLGNIQKIRDEIAQASAAAQACDRKGIDRWISRLAKSTHAALAPVKEELQSARERCQPSREDQIATANAFCLRKYPGSVATDYVSPSRYNCNCPAGRVWSKDGASCVKDPQAAIVAAQQSCAKRYPGSIPTQMESETRFRCKCPDGQRWNGDRSACISLQQAAQEACNRDFPNSVPVQVLANGQYRCNCPQGYMWGPGNRQCFTVQQVQAAGQQACGAGHFPVEMQQDGNFLCCPNGSRWDTGRRQCINVAAEAAADAAAAAQAVGTIIDALGGLSGGRTQPPPRKPSNCHRRPDGTMHCGAN